MLTPDEESYIARMAWEATKGIMGADSAVPDGELHDAIATAVTNIAEAAYQRGVQASMIQLSLVPDAVKAVG